MAELTYVDLNKFLIRSYIDPGITASFSEAVYDYFMGTTGLQKISYNDCGAGIYKEIVVTTGLSADTNQVKCDITYMFQRFVYDMLHQNDLQHILSNIDPNYESLKLLSPEKIYNFASFCISILDISTGTDNKVFKIILI